MGLRVVLYMMHAMCMVWRAIKNGIKKMLRCDKQVVWQKCTGMRIIILIGAGILGVCFSPALTSLAAYFSGVFFSYTHFKDDGLERVQFTMATILVILAVWYFRNYDRKEALEANYIQIEQNDLFNALDNLISQQPAKIDIGVARLIEMHKTNNALYERIRQPFITRLKTCPLNKETRRVGSTRLTYAQWILQWLTDNMPDNTEIDLSYSDFACQDFIIDTPFARLCGTTKFQPHVSFWWANLQGADLRGIDLQGADLRHAKLQGANLQGANLQGAHVYKNALNGARYVDTTGIIWHKSTTITPDMLSTKSDKE